MIKYETLQAFYEKLMNKDTIRLLPRLLEDMDQNMAISIDTFLANPLIKDCKIDKVMLIDIVKNSKEFHYDKKTKMLKFKKKADLNILIVSDFKFKDRQDDLNSEDYVQDKLNFLKKTLLLSCNYKCNSDISSTKDYMNFPSKLRKIQYINENSSFQIIFDAEQWASLAFGFLQDLVNDGYFSKIFEENCELKVSSAAETLKRRILYDLPKNVLEACSFERQLKTIKDIMKDPYKYDPNKFLVDFVYSNSVSASTKYPNYQRQSLNLIFQYQSKNIEKIKTRLNSTEIGIRRQSNENRKRQLSVRETSYGKFMFNHQKGKEYKQSLIAEAATSKNKFNLVMKNQNIENQSLIGGRKLSKAEEKELKSNSKMKRLSTIDVPQNHKYSVNMPIKNVLKIDDYGIKKAENQIKYKYETNELTSVFVHLLYLKKFMNVPEEFAKAEDKEMILDITHPFPKTIEHFLESTKDGNEKLNQKYHKASADIKRNSYYGISYQSNNYYIILRRKINKEQPKLQA